MKRLNVCLMVLVCLSVLSQAGVETFDQAVIGVAPAPPAPTNERAIIYPNVDLDQTPWWSTQGYGNVWVVNSGAGSSQGAFATLGNATQYARCMIHAKRDDKKTTGVQTLEMDILFTQGQFAVRVIGMQDPEMDGWDGGIQGSGGSGNFGAEQSTDYRSGPTYAWNSAFPADGTRIFSAFSRTGGISMDSNWQHVSFDVDMGSGYDWVLICIGESLNVDGVTDIPLKLGVDNVSFATIDSAAVEAINPLNGATIDVSPSTINFQWTMSGDVVVKDYEFILSTDPNMSNASAWLVAPTPVQPAEAAPALPTAPQADPSGSYAYDHGTVFPYATPYYWSIAANVYEPNEAFKLSIPEPNSVYNNPSSFSPRVFTFETVSASPVVDAGADDYSWVGDSYPLDGSVSDIDTPIGSIALQWTASDPNATISNPAILNPTVTFAVDKTYTLTLTADDGENPPVSDSVEILVYATECDAAKAENGYGQGTALFRGDANYDCTVDLDDLARVAQFWLVTEPGR